jgi:cell fate regulator YaaT (PSP1 superfamily)
MLPTHDYLLSYGRAGDFGRFYPVQPLVCRRGDRAVIRTPRGLELGTVLCATAPGHARYFPNTSVGELLRLAASEDERTAERMHQRSQQIFADGRRTTAEMQLPIELLDVEVLLDGGRAVIYHVRWGECDVRPLVSSLARHHDLQIELQDLSREETGCGRPDCGQGKGGCGSCGSGGGCSTCGSDLQAYFSQLRDQMHAQRTPLL